MLLLLNLVQVNIQGQQGLPVHTYLHDFLISNTLHNLHLYKKKSTYWVYITILNILFFVVSLFPVLLCFISFSHCVLYTSSIVDATIHPFLVVSL